MPPTALDARRRRLLQAGAVALAMPALAVSAGGAQAQPREAADRASEPWWQQGALYELNIRQHTAEGTLRAAADDLPRLRSMGVGAVWLMPLQPIGLERRKGSLGSYYAIRDYTATNPEFGTLEDVRHFVRTAHSLGLKVLLDWVANHTAWDHAWVQQHPEWYRRNERGEISAVKANPQEPNDTEYWEDVAWLDYAQPELWVAMMEAMRFWRTEIGMDGFRCDVAGFLPERFWTLARQVLAQDGPLFLLAESDDPALHAAFDASYDWRLQRTLQALAKGQADAQDLQGWWVHRVQQYPVGSIGMNFLTNHDLNSWHGSDEELYGTPATAQAMAVLMATLPGLPLLYSGQESFHRRRLAFFEKDPIDWGSRSQQGFYSQLLRLRQSTPALSAPLALDGLEWVPDRNSRVITFRRRASNGSRIQISVNLSGQPQTALGSLKLPPWGWRAGAPTKNATAARPSRPNPAVKPKPASGSTPRKAPASGARPPSR